MWSIEQNFQWPWTTPTPSFKVAPFFDAEYLISGSTYRHCFNEILIVTYTRPNQQCHFEWPWVISSHFPKYSMTRIVALFSATAEVLVGTQLCKWILTILVSLLHCMPCASLTWWRNVDVTEIMPFTDTVPVTLSPCCRERRQILPLQRCGHPICQIWIQWTTASGVSFKRGFTVCGPMMW